MKVDTVSRWSLKVALLLSFVVIGLGAYTRLSNAGLGCPDWPGCYGQWRVPQTVKERGLAHAKFPDAPIETRKAWIEMIHRYAAGTLGLLCLFLLFLSRKRQAQPILSRPLLLSLMAVISAQVILGLWTVSLKLWPTIVLAHLFGGFSTVVLISLLNARAAELPRFSVTARQSFYLKLSLACLVVQIFLGAWTSANYAALACTDFPTCHGQWWPEHLNWAQALDFARPLHAGSDMSYAGRLSVHWAHRVGALVTFLVLAYTTHQLRTAVRGPTRGLNQILSVLLIVQICLGITNVLKALPLNIATAHNMVAAALLSILATLIYLSSNAHHLRRT